MGNKMFTVHAYKITNMYTCYQCMNSSRYMGLIPTTIMRGHLLFLR